MVNTQTLPKLDHSQKTMVQYSNRAKTCHLSEKDGTILKQSQKLIKVGKNGTILKQIQKLSPARKRWYNTETVLKQSQNLSPVKKRWCNSQTVPKPANSQKKMVQYSNRAKTC